jgi:non-homologous end joining protein Ku
MSYGAGARHYTLSLRGKKELTVKVTWYKTTDVPASFKMTHPDPDTGELRPVNTIRVLPKEVGVRPTNPDEVAVVVGWTDVTPCFVYKNEEGEEQKLPIDKKVIAELFPKSDKMKGVRFLPKDQFDFSDMSGDHYFIVPRVDSKTKTSDPSDLQGYALLKTILSSKKLVLVVKYVYYEREHTAVIYMKGDTMMCSKLIGSNYHRAPPRIVCHEALANINVPKTAADRVAAALMATELKPDMYADDYEIQLKAYIKSLQQEKAGIKPIRPIAPSLSHGNDLFSQLDDF